MLVKDFGTYELSGWPARLLRWSQSLPANGLGRRLALILRKLVRKSGHTQIDAEIGGIKLRFYTEDNVSERKFLFMPQFYDVQERALMAETLQSDGVFVDIGANVGIYTLHAAKCLPQGRVIACEPNPKVMQRLQYNVAINGFENQVTALQIAVADQDGVLKLALDPTNLGGSSLTEKRSSDEIEVPVRSLLSVLLQEGVTQIDMLKIDIEGAEDKALLPFFETAPQNLFPGFIIMENSNHLWKSDVFATLAARGYSQHLKTRMNVVFAR